MQEKLFPISAGDFLLSSCLYHVYQIHKTPWGFSLQETLPYGLFLFFVFFNCNSSQKSLISNGNRTEWSPIWSIIIRVITKSDDRAAGVRFVYHKYDYRPNWTRRSSITN